MHSLNLVFSFINLILTNFALCQEMKYKIVVPGYICKSNTEKNELKIRLMGSDAQKLEYKWAVNFNKIGTCRNFQRCTLLAWQSVRDLEKHLQNYPKEQMQTGTIEINRTMLIPGIEYLFNVSVINNDIVMERKQYKMEFMDETVPTSPEKFLGSINLIAADTTFADAVYFIHADILTCSNEDYYLSWQLLDSSENVIKNFPNKGTELEIRPNTFKAPHKYGIRGKLMNSENEEIHWVNTLKKGLIVYLPVKNLTVGLGQAVVVNAFIKDPDNSKNDEFQIKWRVFNKSTGQEHPDVPNESKTTLEIDLGFYEKGIYTIEVKASKGEDTKKDSCDVMVIEENVPVIEVDEIEDTLSTSNEIEIHTTVKQLTAGCVMQWNCINTDQSEHLDLNEVPGNVNKVQIIEVDEDPLLGELQEFSNETLDKQFDLKIAPAQGEWNGLKGDANYVFQLNITCARPIVREATDNDTEPLIEHLNSFAEIEIHTNAPPNLKPLKIKPSQGEALCTNFIYETENAEDDTHDLPVTYKFGYMLDQTAIVFSNLNYLTEVQTILPYQVNGTQTFIEGCDSKGACKKIFGPIIKATLPVTYNKTSLLMKFTNMLSREEYYKAYNYALILLKTTSFMQTDLLVEVQNFVMNSTNNEITKWNNRGINDESKIIVAELIKNIKEFANEFPLPEEVIKNLITLRDKQISGNSDRLIFRSRNILAIEHTRRKRNQNILDDFKEYLEVSEMIVTKSSDLNKVEQEKLKIIKQFETYMPNFCKMLYEKNQKISLALKTLSLSVTKTSKNTFLTYQMVPFDESLLAKGKIKLGRKLYEKFTNEKLCLGKALLKNYFSKSGSVFFTQLYRANGKIEHISNSNDNINLLIVLPINQSEAKTRNAHCLVWNTNQTEETCKTLTQTFDVVTCICDNLGYYAVQYENDDLLTSVKTTSSYYTLSVPTKADIDSTTKNPLMAVTKKIDNAEIFTHIVSYVLICLSVIGSIILCFATKRLITNNRKKTVDSSEFPKYAHFYDEELLQNPL